MIRFRAHLPALCSVLLALVAQAAYATTTTVCLVDNPGSPRNWQVPSDWTNTGAQAWVVAGGGNGGPGSTGSGGGGAGAGQLAESTGSITPNFTAGQYVSVQVGLGGGGFAAAGAGASWICDTSAPSSPPTCDSKNGDGAWVGVDGAGSGTALPASNNYGSSAGANATGTLPHVSGKGGNGDTNGGGGGGGVQSLSASGGIGGDSSTNGGGNGGSAAGASPASGGTGATATGGVGAAGNSSPVALATCTAGDPGMAGTQVFLGSGGGGGSPNFPNGGSASAYGGGGGGGYGTGTGGNGYQGILVIQYTSGTPPPPGSGANQQLMLMGVGLVANDNAPPAANDDAPIITRRAAL